MVSKLTAWRELIQYQIVVSKTAGAYRLWPSRRGASTQQFTFGKRDVATPSGASRSKFGDFTNNHNNQFALVFQAIDDLMHFRKKKPQRKTGFV